MKSSFMSRSIVCGFSAFSIGDRYFDNMLLRDSIELQTKWLNLRASISLNMNCLFYSPVVTMLEEYFQLLI